MSPCLTSCCPCRGAPAQAPRQRQHEVRQWDTHGSGSAAIRGVPLPNQQRKCCDGPVKVRALRLGRQSGSSCVNGVSPWCTEPPVTKAHHRNDTNPPKECQRIVPSSPKPPGPSGVTNVGPTTAIDTHNLAGTIVPKRVAPPLTPAVHQGATSRRCGHARRRSTPTPRGDAQTTHRARAIMLCALSAAHMPTK